MKELKTGDHVIYHDTFGNEHNALVTSGWGDGSYNPCINLLYVASDENKIDGYGRQIERESSVSHGSQTEAFGRYWRHINEKPNERKQATIK